MSIRLTAGVMEETARDLARRGRGLFGRRERHAHQAIGEFISEAWQVPAGGVLPSEVRNDLQCRIDGTINALEVYVSRDGSESGSRAARDTGIVRQIYALREVQQHLMQTHHMFANWATPMSRPRTH